jgi:hypothetical protein
VIRGVQKTLRRKAHEVTSIRKALGPRRTGQHVDASDTVGNISTTQRPTRFDTLSTNMTKTYKQLKEAWVSGHTGSSVADVNSVSLAMPVPYTYP